MKRFLLVLVAGALAALAIPYVLQVSQRASTATVASLLPHETLAFAHLPDFNATRDDWHRSDIYRLYTDPAIQEFLRKPLEKWSVANWASQRASEVEQLDPKDAFIALVSAEKDHAKFVGGFRFRGKQEAAEQIIAGWRGQLSGGSDQHQTIDYGQHKIEVYGTAPLNTASVYDRDWFFVSNDVEELKALLDRAGKSITSSGAAGSSPSAQSGKPVLGDDEEFRAATKEMPSNYALSFYAQPKLFADKLASMRSGPGQHLPPDQQSAIEHVRSVYATTRFDGGKIHDVIYVGMPQGNNSSTLTRDSIGLATADSFLYVASLVNFSKQLALISAGSGTSIFGGILDKIATALARAKIDPNEWNSAFGAEASLIADWPKDAHWPSGVATFPVKDGQLARKLASVLAHSSDDDATWKEEDRNGVHYITMQSAPGFLILRPTIATSDRVMVIGLDPASVTTAIQRSGSATGGLSATQTYKSASGMVPPPTNFFAYVDLARLYTRFDEALRPILMMWAAFMPAVNNQVDLNRIPAPEIVAKHLSPIVSSQRYANNGYITESIGPITLNQSGLALLGLGIASYRVATPAFLGGSIPPSITQPALSPTPAPAP